MFKRSSIKILVLILIGSFLITTGFQCKLFNFKTKKYLKPLELTYWRVYDDTEDFIDIINAYQTLHPNIIIKYRKLRYQEYEKELLEAMAEDRGPDIFSIQNTWIRKYQPKIEPMPEEITMAYQVTKKSLGIKEETIIELRTKPTLSLRELKNNFLDVVTEDIIINQKVYGLPLSVDTLVMFYNRDLLNNAGIALPPNNWRQFQENVKKLTFQDRGGNLIQSGAALGTYENITRSTDILSLLMMQNGTQMTTDNLITFHLIPPDRSQDYIPGPEALRFYTDFANPAKEVYSWNENQPNSLDAFTQGQVGFFFGYSYHLPYLETKRQGKLNYGIAKVPQIEGNLEVNFANYWVETVSKKSEHLNEAWDFILFATQAQEAKKYLNKTKKPTALRSLIEEQLQNEKLHPFASQLLTSKSWYQGKDALVAEQIFGEMIETTLKGLDPQKATTLAATKIQQTY